MFKGSSIFKLSFLWVIATAGVLTLGMIMGNLTILGFNRLPQQGHTSVHGGDPLRGELAFKTYGCGSCHELNGVEGAFGRVGPRLDGWEEQVFIAGRIPNRPENLIRWIVSPEAIDPQTLMPNVNVTEADARDIAALLYQNREGFFSTR